MWLLVLLAVLGIAALPIFVTSTYYLSVMVFIGLHTIVAVGLCLLMGYAGQISLGHAAFYGLGAYISGILTATYHVSPWLAMLAALVVSSAIAYALGIPILRLHGHFLAMATLGLGIIIYIAFVELADLTGGPSGLSAIPYLELPGIVFDKDWKYYYLVWSVVVLVLLLSWNIVNSRVGRALRAIHGSEIAANTLGVDTAKFKVQVFTLSAAFAALAGSLYAHYLTVLNPAPFSFKFSVELVVMVVVGGMASVWGAVFGAASVTVLTEVLRDLLPRVLENAAGEYEIIVFGLILIVIMICLPEGLTRGLLSLYRRWRRGMDGEQVPAAPGGL
jgi:branched-chain amino acid transport system permease protein